MSYNRVWSSESVFAKIVRLCNVRERTRAELTQRLKRDGIPDDLAKQAIERAESCGLIDELRFAEAFLRGKIASGWGQYRIERELLRFGIDPQELPGEIDEYPEGFFTEESECERALAELARFHTSARNVQDARYRRLLHKGFTASVIKQALAELATQENARADGDGEDDEDDEGRRGYTAGVSSGSDTQNSSVYVEQ